LLIIPLLTVAYFALSIRPTTDYVHLTPLLALSGLPLLLIITNTLHTWVEKISRLLLIGLFAMSMYSAIFLNYYRWDTPLYTQHYWFTQNQTFIAVDKFNYSSLYSLNNYFQKNEITNRQLFIFDYDPAFYVMLNKENPTRYDYLHTGVLSEQTEQDVVNTLQQQQTPFVLTHFPLEESKSRIARFIRRNYQTVHTADEYTVWKKVD
jgi:hypothetical protein